jgi:two-component system chemotaxis sensor kinase CheA
VALVDLAAHLGVPGSQGESEDIVVVVESRTRRLGLLVDGVADTSETLVKPLPLALRSISTYSGVTVLPDGHPILILDVATLLMTSGSDIEGDEGDDDHEQPLGVDSSLLVARGVDGSSVAFALSGVRRLERFATTAIEHHGNGEVIQYRDGLLRLIRVDGVHRRGAGPHQFPPDPTIFETVVYESSIGPIGLVVGRIEDIVDDPGTAALDVDALLTDAGLVGAP